MQYAIKRGWVKRKDQEKGDAPEEEGEK